MEQVELRELRQHRGVVLQQREPVVLARQQLQRPGARGVDTRLHDKHHVPPNALIEQQRRTEPRLVGLVQRGPLRLRHRPSHG